MMALLGVACAFKQAGQRRKMLLAVQLAAVLAEMLDINTNLCSLPRQQSVKYMDRLNPQDFDSASFFEQFRFRHEHFYMFLQALGWTDASGQPVSIKFGQKGHRRTMRTDHILMVFLRKLAFPIRWCDMNRLLGGSRTTNSETYNFALQYFYVEYVPLIQNLDRWKHRFHDFARRLAEMGAPYHNLISFVDGHFDPTARPTGDACAGVNLWDYQMYNPLHKDHGIMYQGLVLVNGIAMCWGPFAGNDNDAKTVMMASIIEDLKHICDEMGVTFSHFADSAYPQGRYMQAIQKCPAGGQLSQQARRFNALMARFRVVIENLFAEVDMVFAALQHKQQKKLGKQDIGKMFQCCVFLHNVRTIMYGSQTSSYYGLDGLLNITLSEFLNKDHEFH